MHLQGMGWDSMSLKIGRLPDVPLDGLSFANYHKSLREDFLMRDASYRGGVNSTDGLFYDVDSNVRDSITDLSINEFVDFLFLNVLQRKPSTDETSDLVAVYTTRGHITTSPTGDDIFRADRYDDVAEITFDYISRLPELYYFRAATQEGGV